MSARKLSSTGSVAPLSIQGQTTQLNLSSTSVRLRKNGIEFISQSELPVFAEISLSLESPIAGKKFQTNGVVVACSGNRHQGYRTSVLFLDLSPAVQERLATMLRA